MALGDGGRHGEEPVELGDELIDSEEELGLPIDGERLPWLETDDEVEEPGLDTGRILAFAASGLVVVALLVGGLWWATRDGADSDRVAGGGTIEAPEGPYKVRPDDPGGRQVSGTGDTSFAVAEGRTVEGRVAETAIPAAKPEPSASASATASASPAPSGVGVQVGAYSRREQAEAGWNQLVARIEPLQGRSHRVVEGLVDGTTVYRLQALAGSLADADALCRAIKASGGDCQVKR